MRQKFVEQGRIKVWFFNLDSMNMLSSCSYFEEEFSFLFSNSGIFVEVIEVNYLEFLGVGEVTLGYVHLDWYVSSGIISSLLCNETQNQHLEYCFAVLKNTQTCSTGRAQLASQY